MKRIHKNISHTALPAKNEYRDQIDLLRSRVTLLTGRDRLLMTMYLENSNSFHQMAVLAEVNEARIARRIHKVIKRLIIEAFSMVGIENEQLTGLKRTSFRKG